MISDASFPYEPNSPSAAETVLSDLKDVCDFFADLEQRDFRTRVVEIEDSEPSIGEEDLQKDFRLGVEEYLQHNPNSDCQMGSVQADIKELCLKVWWK